MKLEKPRKSRRPNGCSDLKLLELWRKAVFLEWGKGCAFHNIGHIPCGSYASCHHVIKRKFLLTRYNYLNGIPLCNIHHGLIDTHEVYDKMLDILQDHYKEFDYIDHFLDFWQGIDKKQYLQNSKMSEAEFLLKMRKDLLQRIKGE